MSVGAGHLMRYAYLSEKGIYLFIFTSLVTLDGNNFPVEQVLNKILELMKLLENIKLEFQQVNSSEFTIIIYERHMIFISVDGVRGRAPYI
jgi:hypothetical protein